MGKQMQYYVYSNIGNRPVNEDSAEAFTNGKNGCFVLCDGLGGHGMGDVASKLVVKKFGEEFYECQDMSKFLDYIFPYAQNALMKKQQELNAQSKMKTTAVAVITDGKKAYVGHAGDSRAYVFSFGKVKKRTLDHSIPQNLVLAKEIKESEIRNHPDRNIVLRVMGVQWENPQYEVDFAESLLFTQAMLLCSDGFWELIEEDEMCRLLKSSSSCQQWVLAMAEIVKKNGEGREMDNNTAIGIWF